MLGRLTHALQELNSDERAIEPQIDAVDRGT